MNSIDVLGNGYVRLVDHMGSDLSIANAARASFAKESTSFNESDERLIAFLAREGHTSPFRHAFATFEFKAPLFVARQHWKYIVGSDHTMDGWNESSRRYITMEPEFYIPEPHQWRTAPENKKQGSGEPIDATKGVFLTDMLRDFIQSGEDLYEMMINEYNIAPEQARLFLPAYAMHVVYRWSASLQSIALFLNQRLDHDAQYEIQLYAKAVQELITPEYPVSFKYLIS